VLSKSDAESKDVVYQDSATESPDRKNDLDVDAGDQPMDVADDVDDWTLRSIGKAVLKVSFIFSDTLVLINTLTKLRKIIRHSRSSPQRMELWKNTLRTTYHLKENEATLMLILDVKTRWSSTHQMLRRSMGSLPLLSFSLGVRPRS
jgi:hypothetical protein